MIRFMPEWLRALVDPTAAAPGVEAAAPWLIAALALGYLLGSIPMGVLASRLFGLGDLRKIGSGGGGSGARCSAAARAPSRRARPGHERPLPRDARGDQVRLAVGASRHDGR